MIWADRVAIFWAGCIYGTILFLGFADFGAVIATPNVYGFVALLSVPVWLFLRGVDWISGGPSRRRGHVRARLL